MRKKLYCYVDESGQDTKGRVFVVSIIVAGDERDKMLKLCEDTEKKSGKGKFKWGKAEHTLRLEYLRILFSKNSFKYKVRYSIFKGKVDYDMATIVAIAKAVHFREPKQYVSSIYIDGLPKTRRQKYGSELRKLGIYTRKVQGVSKDESNSLIRFADTIAGFVRDVLEEKYEDLTKIFSKAKRYKILVEV